MPQKLVNTKIRDSSSKMIFSDPVLCAQFLRGYVDIPILKEVQPENIENVTERYVHMFIEERTADVVNKVYVKENDMPFFLVSLIEHKSKIDYNVVMQILRYMVYIWEDYEREMERKQEGISKTKGFRYPPILPIIFYDGTDNWTAATEFYERVKFSDIFFEYIPNYKCILVQLKDYSNTELMKKRDELSILMLMDRLKDSFDFKELGKEIDAGYLSKVLADSPDYLLNIMVQVIEGFLKKLNVPLEEAEAFTEQIKERHMGEFFENFQGWDVQAIRKEARKEAREEAQKEAYLESIEKMLHAIAVLKLPEETARRLMVEYGMNEKEAKEKVELYLQK